MLLSFATARRHAIDERGTASLGGMGGCGRAVEKSTTAQARVGAAAWRSSARTARGRHRKRRKEQHAFAADLQHACAPEMYTGLPTEILCQVEQKSTPARPGPQFVTSGTAAGEPSRRNSDSGARYSFSNVSTASRERGWPHRSGRAHAISILRADAGTSGCPSRIGTECPRNKQAEREFR